MSGQYAGFAAARAALAERGKPEPPWRSRQRQEERFLDFLREAPYEPMASQAEVLEIACRVCGAEPGQMCDTRPPRPTLIWAVFKGFGSIHTRRYVDRTGDRR